MSDTLANLRKLIDLEIIAETSWMLNSAEIYALRELFAEVEMLKALWIAAEESALYLRHAIAEYWKTGNTELLQEIGCEKGGK